MENHEHDAHEDVTGDDDYDDCELIDVGNVAGNRRLENHDADDYVDEDDSSDCDEDDDNAKDNKVDC